MSDHSPLPWRVEAVTCGEAIEILDAKGDLITSRWDSDCANSADADFALIVKAVNYHARLVAMVRQIPYLTGDGDVRGSARRLLNEIDKET